jgi:small GTP-binding protein
MSNCQREEFYNLAFIDRYDLSSLQGCNPDRGVPYSFIWAESHVAARSVNIYLLNDLVSKSCLIRPIQFASMSEIAPRVITLGDSGVGKTALIHWIKTGEFISDTSPTIGAGVTAVDVEVKGVKYPLQIWDTAGQELYRTIIPIYFRGAVFAIVCFAVNDYRSFEHLDLWLDEIAQHSDPDIGLILVGTKYDSPDKVVNEDAAKRYADQHHLPLLLTSSVTGQNVMALIEYVAVAQAAKDKRQGRGGVTPGEDLGKEAGKKKGGCC